jgi:RimJ/RimL family protein N-acetyltransferase
VANDSLKPPEIIETERLRLRPPVMQDATVIFATYAQDPEVTRYLTWRPHTSIDDTREFLRRCAAGWEQEGPFPWAITLRAGGRLLGLMDLRPGGHRVELGYALGRADWGRGFMTEAVCAVTEWALAQPEIHRVWAVCDVENRASARVLEKVGMEREGILRRWSAHPNVGAIPRDCWCYARVKATETTR